MKNNGTEPWNHKSCKVATRSKKFSTKMKHPISWKHFKSVRQDRRWWSSNLYEVFIRYNHIPRNDFSHQWDGMMVLVSVNHIFCSNGASRQHKACFRLPARKYCLAQASLQIYGWMPREIQQPYSLKACPWKWLPTPATYQGWIYYSTSGGGKHCIMLWRYNLNSDFPSRLGCRDSKLKDWSHKVRSS